MQKKASDRLKGEKELFREMLSEINFKHGIQKCIQQNVDQNTNYLKFKLCRESLAKKQNLEILSLPIEFTLNSLNFTQLLVSDLSFFLIHSKEISVTDKLAFVVIHELLKFHRSKFYGYFRKCKSVLIT